VSCGKSQGFLAENDVRVQETVDAKKRKLGRDDALRLAREAARVIVAKGKRIVRFDMKNDPPDEDALLKHLLGPSGNLRAPTIRTGTTLLVGFHTDAYQEAF
jgi:hypothetical protein